VEKGTTEVITGCMFSGKSEELLRRTKRAIIAHETVRLFKPSIDKRHGEDKISSHSGLAQEAICIDPEKPFDILIHLQDINCDVVAIDEAQFFNEDLFMLLVDDLVDMGIRVIIAGLDTDYKRKPWEPIPTLMALANSVTKFNAICVARVGESTCGKDANCTQRVGGGVERVEIGGEDIYEARCLDHHSIPKLS